MKIDVEQKGIYDSTSFYSKLDALYSLHFMNLKKSIKAFFDLCRISNLPTVWTNVLAAVVLSDSPFSWSSYLILSASLSLFYSGGMSLNDLFDVEVDRVHKLFRPLPSGRASIRDAILFTVVLFGLALFLLFFIPYREALYAGLFLLLVIFLYDQIHKRNPLTVFLIAMCRLMIFVVSGIAVSGTVGKAVVIAGVVQFVYVLVLSLMSRYENSLKRKFPFPFIPLMLACISLLDGIVMALLASPAWLIACLGGTVLTHFGQKYVRGD